MTPCPDPPTKPTCGTNQVQQFVMCRARALQKKGADPSSSMKQAWKEVRELCPITPKTA